MYEKDADGRLFFAANPIGRYFVGDRTHGLQRLLDGNIELRLQNNPPADPRHWLSTPAGAFAMTLRVYGPSTAMLEGRAPLPRLIPAN